jgi:exodeoxyribonuclease V beta subunit
LEASAGTGKTFSIENIVARLLIDEVNPCLLEEIVVVTFTRAATADLKVRIRSNLVKLYALCRQCLKEKTEDFSTYPDFLIAVVEQGEEAIQKVSKAIGQALSLFDKAPIFTIHGFCHRMMNDYLMESDIVSGGSEDKGIPTAIVRRIIRDFFRTQVKAPLITASQLKILLKDQKGVAGLEKKLITLIQKGSDIQPLNSLEALMESLNAAKKEFECDPSQLVADFLSLAPFFKHIAYRNGIFKPENIAKAERSAALFEEREWGIEEVNLLVNEGLYIAEALDPGELKANAKISVKQLYYPDFPSRMQKVLLPIVKELRNPNALLAILASQCQNMLRQQLGKEELMGFDGLLVQMLKAIEQPAFATSIQNRFKAAIIDEFQDTDPVQWKIFSRLFVDHCHLYLVGDPKQSIYGFRQADIYTYLAARRQIGENSSASLDVNYRSTKPLVEALNALFNTQEIPNLIDLPRLNDFLPCEAVESGSRADPIKFADDRGSIHFFSVEEKEKKPFGHLEETYLFPFIAQEILRINQQNGISFNDFAILVADRYQASRIERYFNTLHIPYVGQHGTLLSESMAYSALKELLQAIAMPYQASDLKKGLGGAIIGWQDRDIVELDNHNVWEECLSRCLNLRKIWNERGFAFFFQELLESTWPKKESKVKQSVAEQLLERRGGTEFYHDLLHLAELLAESETNRNSTPKTIIENLEDLVDGNDAASEGIKRRYDPSRQGVRILTIHSSKGLEFEIVFALGIIKRSKFPEGLIPLTDNFESALPPLVPILEKSDPNLKKHLCELDAEKMRQLYVAFTRAKQRLYIPMLLGNALGKCSEGCISPIELYLSKILAADDGLYENIPLIDSSAIYAHLGKLSLVKDIRTSRLEREIFSLEMLNPQIAVESLELQPPGPVRIAGNPITVESFTSLSAKYVSEPILRNKESLVLEFSPHTMPAGRETGILLHAIMESIPFDIAKEGRLSDGLLRHIDRHLRNTILTDWQKVVADIVFNVLTADLSSSQEFFTLSDINEALSYREHEFIYPSDHGYIKGVIDLIFQHQGKYYIVDWKSNWLGHDDASYSQEALMNAMAMHDYFLQANLYKQALKRYLRLFDDHHFEELFGGVIYPFLRGVESGTSKGMVIL